MWWKDPPWPHFLTWNQKLKPWGIIIEYFDQYDLATSTCRAGAVPKRWSFLQEFDVDCDGFRFYAKENSKPSGNGPGEFHWWKGNASGEFKKNSRCQASRNQKRSFFVRKISRRHKRRLMPRITVNGSDFSFCRSVEEVLDYRLVEIVKLIDPLVFSFTRKLTQKINHSVAGERSKPLSRGIKHIKIWIKS